MEIFDIVIKLGTFLLAYMLGSIPWGLIIARGLGHGDIRLHGSGNIGATNVRRVAGTWPAILTLLGDVTKGVIPIWIAITLSASKGTANTVYPSLVGLFTVTGHLFPVYLKFKGCGKGVATAAGCFLVLAPLACFVAIVVFFIGACFANRISVGSLLASAFLPIGVWLDTHSLEPALIAFIISSLIFLRHKDNIKRILAGTEPVFREKKPP
ncbi:MAG: glycerol-3-phosphate 1-O-acyltransferase PlsY [Deltaproteobacteria bacterium]|nr:glycerol-3-phosphate 1-O-acyltransferase PlsY [Deltaproteobacteria bacterium]MBW1960104.1 glycerol-3-phosphate 1-O-acyltransferase PlsY [Deltaproteobacteria bacterium]MBW1993947.1 glycerol-3-phosphate 1-O-acyltransferase PlsY [Deltaproteobacteria bacterium]MBW2153683.1 glycerol-3-phosphate 1-O-acyltransferase PlsY [Deltaproteobacteria bacterium]